MNILAVLFAGLLSSALPAQPHTVPDLSKFEDDIRHWRQEPGRDFPYERYDSTDIRAIADNMLMMQNPDGGWPKNVDWLAKLDRETIWNHLTDHEQPSTCDNRNTYTHIEYLSQVYAILKDDRYREAANRGLGFLLHSQRVNGGWRGADVDAITFNDDVMPGVMNLIQDILEGRPYYEWIDSTRKDSLRIALDRAIDVTLRCQIVVHGTRTAWCQQHDNRTFEPVKARSYELPSITAFESTTVVEFLMRLEHPSIRIQDAITSAVSWLKRSAIHGIRLEFFRADSLQHMSGSRRRYDVRVVADDTAPPIWARYYEIGTNRPFFCNRDGIKVYTLAAVKPERRTGYAWYGYWPAELLGKDYPAWKDRMNASIPRDTSFTLTSAYEKEKRRFPDIRPVFPGPTDNVIVHRDLVYASYGARDLHLDVFTPSDSSRGPRPIVVLVHGGAWSSGNRLLVHPMAQRIAAQGFIAVAPEYRLSPEATYPAAVRDIRKAITWMRNHADEYHGDASHIALFGTSAGGQLAALVGTSCSETLFSAGLDTIEAIPAVQAIVDADGVLDMTTPEESDKRVIPSPGERWLGAPYADRPDLWKEASALNHVSSATPPVLFLNSSNDRFHAGRDQMIAELRQWGVYSEVHTFPHTPHTFWFFEPWFGPTVSTTTAFLRKIFEDAE